MTERAVPRLAELTWPEAAAWFRRDPRLIVPVGTTLQHGPHLPLNSDTQIITAVAEGIGARHGVLIAPTFAFGAPSERAREYAGTAGLGSKALHRVLNELVQGWEEHGVLEFVLITSQGFGPNYEALVSVMAKRARIRAVDINSVDLTALLDHPGPQHAGELETSLMLHLAPVLVRADRIVDAPPEPGSRPDRAGVPPPGSSGVIGVPSAATAEKGRAIYEHLVEFIGTRLYGETEAEMAEMRPVEVSER